MKELLEKVRDEAARRGVQFMDVRAAEKDSTTVRVQDGKADKVSQGRGRSAGVRVLAEGAWGFASTDMVNESSLADSLEAALNMAIVSRERVLDPGAVVKLGAVFDTVHAEVEKDPRSVSLEEKMDRVIAYEKAGVARGEGKLCNTQVGYGDSWAREMVCNTAGTFVEQETIRTSIATMMTAADGDIRQAATERFTEQAGMELLDRIGAEELTEKAAARAVALLSAKRAPSGKFPVILHPSITGLLTHEALGHNAEADHVFNGSSIIEGKIGQQIASPLVSIYDDGTIPKLNGSYRYDSEGTPSQKRTIIEQGVLRGCLHSLETAARFGVAPNGSARAASPHHLPIIRMSNTYILPAARESSATPRSATATRG
ncbi:TldD/PmbA family protein, partial [Planctomycetota bacterium]